MKPNIVRTVIMGAGLAVFALSAAAQHEGHHPGPAAQDPSTTTPEAAGMAGGGMMGMGQMAGQNREMSDTMSKMMQNMAAMQGEKNAAKMKELMAGQSAMMEQMKKQIGDQGDVMQSMPAKMTDMSEMKMQGCPMMMDKGSQPPANK